MIAPKPNYCVVCGGLGLVEVPNHSRDTVYTKCTVCSGAGQINPPIVPSLPTQTDNVTHVSNSNYKKRIEAMVRSLVTGNNGQLINSPYTNANIAQQAKGLIDAIDDLIK